MTLRGGGMFVVDHRETPMQIVAEYDKADVDENGCGEIQAGDKMYVNSGVGTVAANPDNHDVYAFDVDEFGTSRTRRMCPLRSWCTATTAAQAWTPTACS